MARIKDTQNDRIFVGKSIRKRPFESSQEK